MGNTESGIDIMDIDTKGASPVTASQDKLTVKGVEASKKLAAADFVRMEKYKCKIFKVAKEKDVDPALIAAIISRESRAGHTLLKGWGDHGNGFGLMQVDKRYHTPVGAWDSEQHLTQATEILIDFIRKIKEKFSRWSLEQCVKGGIAAYNAGVNKVKSYEDVDEGTTGRDYANDVVARAQWFKTVKDGYLL
uniref:lysozyme g-like 2 n=1 Tax=Danio rerio TaxID=7955 RepID=UPI003D9DF68D